MLRLAATKARGNGLKRIRFCVARWDSLPFTYAKGFDAVLCCGNSIGQLQSSTERKLSLTGMANALVRKGLIYVDFREDYSRNNSGDFIATEVVGPIERERQRLLFVVFERCDKDVIERTKVCYSAGNENLQELRRVVTRYRPFSRRELKDELACAGFEKIKFARRPGKWPLSAFFAIRA
jgi:ubiquinone/menaquinone biosynthesis C-methylase UbiE